MVPFQVIYCLYAIMFHFCIDWCPLGYCFVQSCIFCVLCEILTYYMHHLLCPLDNRIYDYICEIICAILYIFDIWNKLYNNFLLVNALYRRTPYSLTKRLRVAYTLWISCFSLGMVYICWFTLALSLTKPHFYHYSLQRERNGWNRYKANQIYIWLDFTYQM